jgi:site-specific DNA-methyltransferase (adenine-specific)
LFFFSKQRKYYFETQYEHANYDGRKDTVMKGTKKYSVPTGWDQSKGAHNKLVGRYAGEQQNRKHERWTKDNAGNYVRIKRTVWKISSKGFQEAHFAVYPEKLCETPISAGCPAGGIVLDPFGGSGTTGIVAERQNKNSILIELNPEYAQLIEKRFKGEKFKLS